MNRSVSGHLVKIMQKVDDLFKQVGTYRNTYFQYAPILSFLYL